MCQVSVALRHPSKDGVAQDPAEIETLGALSNNMIEALAPVRSEPGPQTGKKGVFYSLTISRVDAPSIEQMARIEQLLIKAATRLGGIYDGWGCFDQSPKPLKE
jgi:hypothetical protein